MGPLSLSGQVGSVDLSVLVNTWPGEIYNAFLFLESEDPAEAMLRSTRVPTPVGDTGIQWRNAAYAVQWWVFALFALWFWGRMVRDEASRGRAGEASRGPGRRGTGRPHRSQRPRGQPVPAGDNGGRDDA